MRNYPIDHILPALKTALLHSPSAVLLAPPGAGKTTRVPLSLLDLVPDGNRRIIILEPRRIAAVSAARWMSRLLGENVGGTVGYTIRFDSCVSKSTRIEVVTEGVLTRRIQRDPGLEGTAMVIFDEFHERSIHSDFALSLCIDVQKALREDLKLLVMSATMDCGPISDVLGNAPVITSAGSSYPVEERWSPDKFAGRLSERISGAVNTALRETNGDILVFLPGAREIRSCNEALSRLLSDTNDISIHPLYGDLPFEQQEAAILPADRRKVVLATNIAETSLTIEGVVAVIDSGLTRRLQYDPSSGMNRLVTINVSRASAEQRKGRAGRLGPGVCYRLYSRQTFDAMVPFASPEILTTDLSSLVLDLAVWGVHEPSGLAWLDAPPSSSWESARRLLTELGCLDKLNRVTGKGKEIAVLPLHPRLGSLLHRAAELGCPSLGADLASLLSERDVFRGGPAGPADPDIAARLDALSFWRDRKKAPDGADPWALKSTDRTATQLKRLISGKSGNSSRDNCGVDIVPLLLLSAFPDRIAKKREDGRGRFVLCNGRGVRIPPECGMAKSDFIIAANLDAGENAEGVVHLAAELDADLIRRELNRNITGIRKVEWDRREGRIVAFEEERLGEIVISSKPLKTSDEENRKVVCDAIGSMPQLLDFNREVRQFSARVALIAKTFPEEDWPDFSDEFLFSHIGEWLAPWLGGIRNAAQLAALNVLPALRARLTWDRQRLIDERAPVSITAPSGSRIVVDYTAGDVPVLAVKLQEMFGLAETPAIAGGKVKLLLHLLSPARRPVQITSDLKGFWNSGYQQVKKELKGRYPKHPWPDDPWNAVPTRRVKSRM